LAYETLGTREEFRSRRDGTHGFFNAACKRARCNGVAIAVEQLASPVIGSAIAFLDLEPAYAVAVGIALALRHDTLEIVLLLNQRISRARAAQ
jgi:hypothetical protein